MTEALIRAERLLAYATDFRVGNYSVRYSLDDEEIERGRWTMTRPWPHSSSQFNTLDQAIKAAENEQGGHPNMFEITGSVPYQEELIAAGEGTHRALLVREPSNSYDTNAIRVEVSDLKLGYVPRHRAAEWAPRMDERGVASEHVTVEVHVDSSSGHYYAVVKDLV